MIFETVVTLITIMIEIGGGIWTVLGVVRLARSLNEKNGHGLQQALMQVVGSIAVIFVTILYRRLCFDWSLILTILFYAGKLVNIFGILWLIYGMINLGDGLKNMNATNLEYGIWQIVGSILILFVSTIFDSLIIRFNDKII